MKIALLSTYQKNGGAAIACNRLKNALNKIDGIEAVMLVQKKTEIDESVIGPNLLGQVKGKLTFILERLFFLLHEKNKKIRFQFSPANFGSLNLKSKALLQADIIHLHWTNQGFISLGQLKKLQKLNKPIIWTLHDMWAFTGGCHYSGECKNYKTECGSCDFLKNPGKRDLSHYIWNRKKGTYHTIQFVTCSKWLKQIANESSLLGEFPVIDVPNPLDTVFFSPIPKDQIITELDLPNNKLFVLYGVMNINDKRKGFDYFKDAMISLAKNEPELASRIELILFGKNQIDSTLDQLGYKIHSFGKVKVEFLKKLYSISNVFVLPSLEDNLPNGISESMACETPVISFKTGGIPEMIIHKKTGYLCDEKTSSSLEEGIKWVLKQDQSVNILGKNSREFVIENYNQEVIAKRYIKLYQKGKEHLIKKI